MVLHLKQLEHFQVELKMVLIQKKYPMLGIMLKQVLHGILELMEQYFSMLDIIRVNLTMIIST
jgi:hypothetical protein